MTNKADLIDPYDQLRDLRILASYFRQELKLIAEGGERLYSALTYEKLLQDVQRRVCNIHDELEAKSL